MIKTTFAFTLMALTLLCFLASTVTAQMIWRESAISKANFAKEKGGSIHLQKLKIIPYMAVRGVYDSNIFLGNNFTDSTIPPGGTEPVKPLESDYIFHVEPGLLLNYDMGVRGSASLGYFGDWAFYDKRSDNDWDMQVGLLDVNYSAPGGLIAGLNNVYSNGNDPYGDTTQFALGETKDRWNNRLRGKLGYEFLTRWRVLGYYNFYKQKYKRDEDFTQDWTKNELGLGGQMKVLPKTWAFLRYHYGKREYDTHRGTTTSDNDAAFQQDRVNTGIAWDGGGKIGGELNVGYTWLEYDNDVDPGGEPYDDKSTWIARTSVNYRAAPLTNLILTVARDIRPTGSSTNEYFIDTYTGIRIEQDLPYKLHGDCGFFYSKNDYNTPRDDDNYRFDFRLRYDIQPWLFAGADYRYWNKDSNYMDQSFKDHQVMITIGSTY